MAIRKSGFYAYLSICLSQATWGQFRNPDPGKTLARMRKSRDSRLPQTGGRVEPAGMSRVTRHVYSDRSGLNQETGGSGPKLTGSR